MRFFPSVRQLVVIELLWAGGAAAAILLLRYPALALLWAGGAVWLLLRHRARSVLLQSGVVSDIRGVWTRRVRTARLSRVLSAETAQSPAGRLLDYCRVTLYLPGRRFSISGLFVSDAQQILDAARQEGELP